MNLVNKIHIFKNFKLKRPKKTSPGGSEATAPRASRFHLKRIRFKRIHFKKFSFKRLFHALDPRRIPWHTIAHDTRMKKLDWYIIKKFLGTYFFSIALIITIVVVFDYNENIDKFAASNAPLRAILFQYYLNFIPYFANLFSSLFVFISVIFFTSKLTENSEIIAMFASGISFKRLLRPYMVSAAFIALLTYVLSAFIIPPSNAKLQAFKVQYMGKDVVETARNIQLVVDTGTVAYIERFEDSNKTGYSFSLDHFDGKKLVAHMTARTIQYDTLNHYKWRAYNWTIRRLDGNRERITSSTKTPFDTIIKIEPADLVVNAGQQESMSSPVLKTYVDRQKERGFANIKEFEIEYHKRIAMSFASFILTLIGVSLSSRKTRGGMGLYLGIGIGLSFTYILFQTISATFAVNGNFPVILAVWLPNILYAIIALFLYRKAPK